jgi:transcriptional regulator GlxA family with amidase domain
MVAGRRPSRSASGRTLSRLFHDELSLTVYQWRTQLRVYHALVLLAAGHQGDGRPAKQRLS